jgi:predicted Zn-dependent protease
MADQDRALSIAEKVLRFARSADQAQVTVNITSGSYARFARNYVTQNLTGNQTQVTLAYYQGKKSGTTTTDDLSDASLTRLVESAKAIAERVPPDTDFVSLPKPGHIPPPGKSYFPETADATPDDRVARLLPVFARMKASKLSCAGYTTTQVNTTAIASSLGVRAAFTGTLGGLELKAMAPSTSGYAAFFAPDYGKLDSASLAERAAARATLSSDPQDLAPGMYTVLLEAPAFADALSAILGGMDAFNVLDDKDSWMVGRIGKPLFSRNLTIVDDWSDPLLANAPFDPGEGVPTKKLTLVENGVPKSYVAGTYLANKFKIPSTGHSFNYPINAVVKPGTKSREELIASIERGVLISRTWYSRVVSPRDATITGLTRDGVYLIENGKLTKTLKNFRYFTSMLESLNDVELGSTQYLTGPGETGIPIVVPDAKIARFNLSAQTSFA